MRPKHSPSVPALRHRSRDTLLLGVLPGLGVLLLGAAAMAGPSAKRAAAPAPVDYGRDIRPIFAANCFACHGQDPGARQANLRLDLREGAIALRHGRRAVEPGKPDKSTLIARVNATDGLVMPPEPSGHRLTPAQKRLLTQWVKQGAPYANHWSFAPVTRPAAPKVRNQGWLRNSLDAFVLARLEKASLAPAPEADRYTLLRRVSLDLTGLPPTPEETTQFLKACEAEDRERSEHHSPAQPHTPAQRTPPGAGLHAPGAAVHSRATSAYEKVVDRLLASPRYGEHWARMWLDLARYADTQGYEKDGARTIWRYRDWVIDAFNADMPYDQFTIEQLAGDLLPNPTPSQLLATAFHRNTMTNTEGGVDPEEFRTTAVKDRVDTTAQVWMGLTMGCAKCHTHKYDPITIQEYYRFYALFNQTEDANRFDEAPTMQIASPEQEKQRTALDEKLKGLREAFARPRAELDARQLEWEKSLAALNLWTPLRYESVSATSGATFHPRPDGAVVVGGGKQEKDTYTLILPVPPAPLTALRLEALKDPSLPSGGPGRHSSDQNVVTSELTVELVSSDGSDRKAIPLRNARADFQQNGWPVTAAIDGNPETGWAWSPQNAQPHVAVFDLRAPVPTPGSKLVVTIRQNFPHLQHGCFRLSVSGAQPELLNAELRPLAELARIARDQRTPDVQKRLDEVFRQINEPTASIYREIATVERERAAIDAPLPRTPIMRDLPIERARVTRIHQRGNFLDPGETVTPGVPTAFGPFPTDTPLNRLGAARWILSPQNPLTARVAVNRIWARLFGTGLVESEEDFGTQGNLPSHPELLNYLASVYSSPSAANVAPGVRGQGSGVRGRTLVAAASSEARVRGSQYALRNTHYADPATGQSSTPSNSGLGWSTKALLKTIVMSATYRQAGQASPAKLEADPRNLLLSRGPRFRLSAEVIRDQALAVSGLLSVKTHGPSVMPPQPDGLWKTVYSGLKWKTSEGVDRYRRALYTFLRRTSPYPSLTTFDAGSGEFCVIRRVRTNTPLQALVTLNDPAFVEAAGALGKAMFSEKGSVRERLLVGFRRVLAREPAAEELARLVRLQETSLADFRARPEAAKSLLDAANSPAGSEPAAPEQASYTVVANVLLNLDEVLIKP